MTRRAPHPSRQVVSRPDQFTALAAVIEEERADPNHKIIVFFTTARLTQFYAELFNLYGIQASPHPSGETHT